MTITFASSSNVVTASATDSRVTFEPQYVAVLIDGDPITFSTGSLELLKTGHKLMGMGETGSALFVSPGKIYTYYT